MPIPSVSQSIVTLDLEGVLVPEVWVAVAEETGIEALRRTTRDEPDYDVLMKYRLNILKENNLDYEAITKVIDSLLPLPGAVEFLNELRSFTQVVMLSDTFEEFAQPLMRKLGWPTILCHRLVIENGFITDYRLRMSDPKRKAVQAFQALNYRVIAAGDSYNDTTMLLAADAGYLFNAPQNVVQEFPQLTALSSYESLLTAIKSHLSPVS